MGSNINGVKLQNHSEGEGYVRSRTNVRARFGGQGLSRLMNYIVLGGLPVRISYYMREE